MCLHIQYGKGNGISVKYFILVMTCKCICLHSLHPISAETVKMLYKCELFTV